jgi:hypothetical protein
MDMMSVADMVCSCFCSLLNEVFIDEINSFKSVLLKRSANMIAIAYMSFVPYV